MLTSWLPYLEKKVTLARGGWTTTRTTLKLDSKESMPVFFNKAYSVRIRVTFKNITVNKSAFFIIIVISQPMKLAILKM